MATEAAPTAIDGTATPAAPADATPAVAQPTPAPADDGGLAQAAAEHLADLEAIGKPAEKPAESVAGDPDPAGAKKPEGEQSGQQPAGDGQDKPSETTDPNKGKPDDKPDDPKEGKEEAVPAAMSKYLKGYERAIAREKEAKTKSEQLDKDRKDFEGVKEKAQKAIGVVNELAHLAERSPVEAIERLLGTALLVDENSTLVTDLLSHIAARRSGAPAVSDEERIRRQVQAEFKASEEAQRKSQEEAGKKSEQDRKTALEQKKAAYFIGLNEAFRISADKYPFLQDEPIDRVTEAEPFLQNYASKNGKLPTDEELFDHFEKLRETTAMARVEKLQKKGKLNIGNPQQPKPVVTGSPSSSVRTGVDSRGRVSPPARPGAFDVEAERDRIARELDAQFRS